MKALFVGTLLICVGAVGFASELRFGVVESDAEGKPCVTFEVPTLKLPSRFVAVFAEEHLTIDAGAVTRSSEPCSFRGDLGGVSYRAEKTTARARDIDGVGVAVTGGPYRVHFERSGARLTSRTGDVMKVRSCASSEGLHLTAWRGRKRIWHEYYYLGYDVEPTCTEEEWRE